MKFLIYKIGPSVLVGGFLALGFYYLVPGSTRADMIALFALVVSIWQAGIARWESIPTGALARIQLEKEIQKDQIVKKGDVKVLLIKRSPSTYTLTAQNNGSVEVKNISLKVLPFGNGQPPQVITQEPNVINHMNPGDTVLIAFTSFLEGTSNTFMVEANWEDSEGIKRSSMMTLST
jgi:hypothetical protein